ncbi:MAG: hypothetical protein Q4P07_02675 [Ornithinimicrobium sp.]|uniref:4'-phosphopantetheinyl transferase family protein n=1 Tax=Ornithinimicrobium sp. TaxID=1977084 RepID=UPI0026DF13C2|nr:hypothetical protein [Ornithinimicrobium sp.]MDO5739033.1 hypothetical protein [Ornithinimicrobium sp.]
MDHDVDVWWADLTAADVQLHQFLPEAERLRVSELSAAADRGRRLVAAALLQHAVHASRLAGRDAGSGHQGPVTVDRTCDECGAQHGRPVVQGGPHLSVAHAGVLVVVATCSTARVGVDVERTDRLDAQAWVEHEARVKTAAHADAPVIALQAPFDGYVAALCVVPSDPIEASAVVSVRTHRWAG